MNDNYNDYIGKTLVFDQRPVPNVYGVNKVTQFSDEHNEKKFSMLPNGTRVVKVGTYEKSCNDRLIVEIDENCIIRRTHIM